MSGNDNQFKYALPSVHVVDEVRACVVVPVLPVCSASRSLVSRIVPITSIESSLIDDDASPGAADMALAASIDHHQRIVLSQAGVTKGLGSRKRARDGNSDEKDANKFFSPNALADTETVMNTAAHPFATDLLMPPYAPTSPMAVVEWADGGVACTHDTNGLGYEEQVRLRYSLYLRRLSTQSNANAIHTPAIRCGMASDIAAEQLKRLWGTELLRRHRGMRDSRAMHSCLPPSHFYSLFEGHVTMVPLSQIADSLLQDYDTLQGCRIIRQHVGSSEGHEHKLKTMDEDHDTLLLMGMPKAEAWEVARSIKDIIAEALKQANIGRSYLGARLQNTAPANYSQLLSESQLIISEVFDTAFYRNDRLSLGMAMYSFTLGHPSRPYGHRSLPFRLLVDEFEDQVKDLMGLLLNYAEASMPQPDNTSTIVSAIVNCAMTLVGAHLQRLRVMIRSTLATYVVDGIHRYVVVAVRNKMKRVEKKIENMPPDVKEALDYLNNRTPYDRLFTAAHKRLLVNADAASETSLLPADFWPTFAAEQSKVLIRNAAYVTLAVEKCKAEVTKMGRSHTYLEVNSAYYFKQI